MFYIYDYLFLKARKRLNQILSDIIDDRSEKRVVEKDLLGQFLSFGDEKGRILTKSEISDNIIGVLFAAQDTTASVLTWILKYLHDNPKLLEAVKVCVIINVKKKITCETLYNLQLYVFVRRQSKTQYSKKMMEGRSH